MVCTSQSRNDSRKLSTMMATPIMAVSAMPRAAIATPVRLSDAAMSAQASRAAGPMRAPSRAPPTASACSAAGVAAATLSSSRNSAANPARRLRLEVAMQSTAPSANSRLAHRIDRHHEVQVVDGLRYQTHEAAPDEQSDQHSADRSGKSQHRRLSE